MLIRPLPLDVAVAHHAHSPLYCLCFGAFPYELWSSLSCSTKSNTVHCNSVSLFEVYIFIKDRWVILLFISTSHSGCELYTFGSPAWTHCKNEWKPWRKCKIGKQMQVSTLASFEQFWWGARCCLLCCFCSLLTLDQNLNIAIQCASEIKTSFRLTKDFPFTVILSKGDRWETCYRFTLSRCQSSEHFQNFLDANKTLSRRFLNLPVYSIICSFVATQWLIRKPSTGCCQVLL